MAPKMVSVTVKYSKPGTQPPIYLAGSFSDPEWQPQEMQHTTKEENEYEFTKEVEVEEGKEYQYKFRIGSGEWWVLNEDSPTVTDSIGNRNNLLTIPHHQENKEKSEETKEPTQSPLMGETDAVQNTSAEPTQSERAFDSISGLPEKLGGDIASTPPARTTQTQAEQTKDTKEISGTPPTDSTISTPASIEKMQVEAVEDPNTSMVDSADTTTSTPPLTIEDSNIERAEEQLTNSNDDPVDQSTSTQSSIMSSSAERVKETEGVSPIDSAEETTSSSIMEQAQFKDVHNTKGSPQTPPSSDTALTPISSGEDGQPNIESKDIKPSKVASPEKVSSPTLVIEKLDLEPRHNDDFDAVATVGQNDSDHLRAQGAEPDHVVIREQSRTPDIAAEVAESAAILDREQPTPPISDEEAGMIGYRRMSSTPIPEVANTAAEVADVAAALDKDVEPDIDTTLVGAAPKVDKMPETIKQLEGDMKKEGNNDRMEYLRSRDHHLYRVGREADRMKPSEETRRLWRNICWAREEELEELKKQEEERRAHNEIGEDPNIVQFPAIPEGISNLLAEQARNAEYDRKLEADIAEEEDRLEFYRYRARVEAGEIVPTKHDGSPNLGSIDEDDEDEGLTTSLASTSDNASSKKTPAEADGTEADEGAVGKEDESKGIQDKTNGIDTDGDLTGKENEPIVEIREVSPESPPTATGGSFESISQDGSRAVPSPVTQFVLGNPQLGNDADPIREASTGTEGPNIMVQPATPGGSSTKTDPSSKPVDTAKATAMEEENGRSQLKSRNKQPVPTAERPLTPSSMRSAGQDAKSKNFLKAFWRVVFVDWIGGLIMRLCGGRRHT